VAGSRRKLPALVPVEKHRRNKSYGRRWRTVRRAVLVRDGYRCQIRGPGCKGVATVVDHVTPESVTGPVYDAARLRSACQSCNTWVAARHGDRGSQPELSGPCPHRLPDGWCVGRHLEGHWTIWYVGSPSAPWWGPEDDPPRAPGGGIA
jgi:hypothetical protein